MSILSYIAPFDSAMQAQATRKERFVWLAYMGILFFLLYGSANELASITAPHLSLFWDWERNIPFISSFVVPYMSSDLIFIIAFLVPQTRFEIRVLSMRVLFIVLLSVIVFVCFPLQFAFNKPEADNFQLLFTMLEADKPFNQLPSLHVSFAIVFWYSMKSHMPNLFIKGFLAIWLSAVALSTLFVYQHHFVDLPTGLFIGFLAVYLFRAGRNEKILNLFMTPRHLKMGLYFLLGCIPLMILSFSVSPLFIYIFISMLSISIIYAFGFNTLLTETNSKPDMLQWIIFAPYFIGSKISWYFYKQTIPLYAQVEEGIFIGRYPTIHEYEKISALGVTQVVNLATELPFDKTKLTQYRFNFLDQTMQDPKSLHQIVLLIEKIKKEGVYIHCALGLSRSVLVIWAWMAFRGKSEQEITKLLTKIRPRYVQSKYMAINIDLYRQYLGKQQ